jgi:DNA-binding response OmpR family regulator
MQRTILLIEDDPDITRLATAYLEREGYRVAVERDGAAGLLRCLRDRPDLVVLDWMLPSTSGIEVLRRLRRDSNVPVLFLTARSEEADRVLGLELGADDYLTKPFSPRELAARVGAILRRSQPAPEGRSVVRHGPLEIDLAGHVVLLDGDPVALTALEFELLRTLAEAPGRVFGRQALLERLWTEAYSGSDRVVDVHISNLRQKLAAASPIDLIHTVRGVGYTLR